MGLDNKLYVQSGSALTDCTKLISAGFTSRTAMLIYGYEYLEWPMEPAIESFETLASQYLTLGVRSQSDVEGLVHPIHRNGRAIRGSQDRVRRLSSLCA